MSTTDVEPDDTCTQAQAEKWLDQEVRGFHDAVLRLTAGMPITKYQHAAMTSLSYNVGIESFGRSSVLRRHRTGDYFQAADTFLMWKDYGQREEGGIERIE